MTITCDLIFYIRWLELDTTLARLVGEIYNSEYKGMDTTDYMWEYIKEKENIRNVIAYGKF